METIKDKEYIRKFSGRLVFDFTVYDIVASGKIIPDFTYYENLYAFKYNNSLANNGKTYSFGKQNLKMVIQLGNALTERIFYMNEYKIPIMMIQNSVVYILDDYAKSATDLLIEVMAPAGRHYEY